MSGYSKHPGSGYDDGRSELKNNRHWVWRLFGVLLQIVAFPLGAVVLLATCLAAALLINSPVAWISAGVAACMLVMLLITYLAVGSLGLVRRWPIAIVISGVATCVMFFVFAVLFLKPLVSIEQLSAREMPENAEFWHLHTGSVVAVQKISALGAKRATPILFLHGGPGAYSVSLRPTVDVISRLSDDGYDVYFYDQVGGGLSARLPDISEYTLDRHLEDLNAVYERIGSKEIILIGSSGGASLAASYMAIHPTHVAAAVFSGPSPIFHPVWNDVGDGGLDERLTPDQRAAFSAMVETPRLLAAIVLADINPRAAVLFAGEDELGSLFDKVANEFYIPIAVCDMDGINVASNGYGFWSNRMTTKSLRTRAQDPRPSLRKNSTPVLVLRGECDYKKEQVAREYVSVFANAKFRIFKDAGHMLFWEKPDAFLVFVRQFLAEATKINSQR